MFEKRTERQSRALHLFFEMLALALNESGNDMKKVLKPHVDIPWSKETVKEYLWKPMQEAQLMKKSTTELDRKEIDKVYETLNRYLGENTGVFVAFPSEESLTK